MTIEISRIGKHILRRADGTEISQHNELKEAYERASQQPSGTYTIITADEKCVVKRDVVVPPIDPPPIDPPIDPPDPPPVNTGCPLWMNTDKEVYYSNLNRCLDLMKRSSDWTNFGTSAPYVIGRDGWIESMEPGASILCYVVFGSQHTLFAAGDYVVCGVPATLKPSLRVGGKITNVVTHPDNRITFTVGPDAGNETHLSFILQNKGTTRVENVRGIHITLIGDEQKAIDGMYYNQAYTDLQKYYSPKGTRTMTSSNASFPKTAHPKTPADLVHFTKARRSYAADNGYVPFDVLAKFASDLKQDFWFCFPILRDSLSFRFDSATERVHVSEVRPTPTNHGWPDGTAFYFGIEGANYGFPNHKIYYTINGSGDSFQVAATPGGAPIDITADLNYSWTYVSRWFTEADHLALWRAIVETQIKPSYQHTGEIWFEVGNEPWNSIFGNGSYFQHVGVHMAHNADANNYQSRMGYGLAHLHLLAMKVMREFYPANRLRCQLNTQVAWFDHLNRTWDYVDPGLVEAGKALKNIAGFECAIAPYIAPCKPGTTDGNNFTFADMIALDMANWTDQQWKEAYLANLPKVKSWIVDVRTRLNGKNPAIPITTYEDGQHLWVEAGATTPEFIAIRDRFHAFLNSEAMADVIKIAYKELHVDFGVKNYAQFVDLGFAMARYIEGWGVTNHILSPKNPRAQFLASIGERV